MLRLPPPNRGQLGAREGHVTTYREPAPIAVDPPPPKVKKRRVVDEPKGFSLVLWTQMAFQACGQVALMFVDGIVLHGWIALVMFEIALTIVAIESCVHSHVVEVVDER